MNLNPLNFSSVRYVENDKSEIIRPSSAVTFGALLGNATNGPVNDIIQLSSKDVLKYLYGKANENNFKEWLQISRAFNYSIDNVGPTALVTRVLGAGSVNGALGVTDRTIVNHTSLTTQAINNSDEALAPIVTFDSIGVDSVTTDTLLVDLVANPITIVTGTGDAGSYIVITEDISGDVIGTGVVDVNGDFSIEVTGLADGTYNITLTATASESRLKFFSKYPTQDTYKIALANSADFDTAEIETGVSFKEVFAFAPTNTEVAVAVIVENEVQETFLVDLVDGNVDGFGESNYIEEVINTRSRYILAYVNDSLDTIPVSFEATELTLGLVNAPTTADYETALALYEDIEGVDVRYFLGNDEVISQQITLCESRLDCQLVWTSKPSDIVGKVPQIILNDLVTYTTTTLNRDTTYAEYFGNVGLVRDTDNNKTRWISLSGDLIGLRIFKNLTGQPWEASAGLNNGQLKDVIKLGWNPTPNQMNTLGKNKINPIISKHGRGTVSWGIRNYTAKESALTDSTTRGLNIYLWKNIRSFLEFFLFEINDDITRSNVKVKIDQFMNQVVANRGIYSYRSIINETNNTPQVIDNGQLVVDLHIKPTRIIKEIQLRLTLHSSGADLEVL